ncbi:IS200/IS605 family transposase [Candidatus Dependentiae bacterium]|nr:IS200/IS605 family transposase [Candidatus Dependentiae bacterium]
MKQMKYQPGAHTKHRLMYHLVWIPKYRKRLLTGKLAERLKKLFEECAEVNDWKIEELNIQPDHVHMLLQLPPKISVSEAMRIIKGGSSRVVREEFPELKEFLWGTSFWADGFFAETIGKVDEAKIRDYIINQ